LNIALILKVLGTKISKEPHLVSVKPWFAFCVKFHLKRKQTNGQRHVSLSVVSVRDVHPMGGWSAMLAS